MARPSRVLIGPILAFASRLRFPVLFALTAVLFVVDLVVPDAFPLVDETLLGLMALLLASWKKRRTETPGEAPDPDSASDEPAAD